MEVEPGHWFVHGNRPLLLVRLSSVLWHVDYGEERSFLIADELRRDHRAVNVQLSGYRLAVQPSRYHPLVRESLEMLVLDGFHDALDVIAEFFILATGFQSQLFQRRLIHVEHTHRLEGIDCSTDRLFHLLCQRDDRYGSMFCLAIVILTFLDFSVHDGYFFQTLHSLLLVSLFGHFFNCLVRIIGGYGL